MENGNKNGVCCVAVTVSIEFAITLYYLLSHGTMTMTICQNLVVIQ